ncbi:MAG: hypothetical protein WBO10_09955 [Pyrinomonadaceae bacterium]
MPRRIRIGEEEVGIEDFGDFLVPHEFDAVVGSNGENLVLDRQEHRADGIGNGFRRFGFDLF